MFQHIDAIIWKFEIKDNRYRSKMQYVFVSVLNFGCDIEILEKFLINSSILFEIQ